MNTGLEVFLREGCTALRGLRVGLCCNPTAVDRDYRHAIDLLLGEGVEIARLFGPEHGVRATLQDMEHVHEQRDPVTGISTVSLYGSTEASLHPRPEDLRDLDVVLFDIQDIGTRFYTYQATLAFLMEVAGQVGTRVIVLDRPNPIAGHKVEGNVVQPGFESFVGAYPLAVRHGMTMGELARFFQKFCGISCEVEVVQLQSWRRDQWLDQTDAPWVYPSPNMPTLETATVYPGMCLFEGTNLSEGRGTTRPFNLFGAPWIDPQALARLCEEGASRYGLRGVRFRPAAFVPGFQKHARQSCGGVEIHLVDREVLDAFLLGLVTVEASYRADPENFAWRTETYEYVDDPIAIDLLIGQADYRACVEARGDLRELAPAWAEQRADFMQARRECLLYT